MGLNIDKSQLIINAFLLLPKCQVAQIVGGLISYKYSHPHTNTKHATPEAKYVEQSLHDTNPMLQKHLNGYGEKQPLLKLKFPLAKRLSLRECYRQTHFKVTT